MKGQAMMKPMLAEDDDPFLFPQGLAGFDEAHTYGFIYEGHGDIVCLQSIDQPEAAFLVTPWDSERLGPTPELNGEQRECLQANGDSDILWMLVLNPFADTEWVTANLRAPIAINGESRTGLQCIQQNPELDIRYRWMPQPE